MKRLILFDIDGTLIASRGVGSKAMRRAMERFAGSSEAMGRVRMAGMCDWAIWREALGSEGYSHEEVDAQLPELYRVYVAELAAVLASEQEAQPEVLPGIRPLLERLVAREEVLLGLLTGNVEAGAWLKLGAVGLDGYFRFGAFGNESANRGDLPAIAVARAARFARGARFTGHEVVIVGDTVHDVRCGASLGACSVGVATGGDTIEALRAAGADLLFDSFADHEAAARRLLGAGELL